MTRFIGGVFGDCRPVTANVPSITGVYPADDQYLIKQEGGWLDTANIVASGGTEHTYTDPTGSWKSHTFNSSGSFQVTSEPGGPTFDAEFLVQGGGGGCKDNISGNRHAGSGAGGLLYGPAGTLVNATYTVTIGAGGNESPGSNTTLGGAPGASIGPTGQTATGGGAGGAGDPSPDCIGDAGGCGGGGWYQSPGGGGPGSQPSPGLSGITVGKGDGSPGNSAPEYGGAGGGTGGNAPGQGLNKGPGTGNVYRYGTTNPQPYGAGGVASDYPSTNRNSGGGANTGDGASGYATGGSGTVIIRYKV